MHVKEQAAKRYGGQTDRLRSFGAVEGTTTGKDVSRRSGFTGTQKLDVARKGGFEGTQNRDVARREGRFGKMNPDRSRAFTQRTQLRPSTPDLRRRAGELRMNNKKHEGPPLKEKKMNNFIHNPYQISPETMVNEDYSRRVFEDSFDTADSESKAAQAELEKKRLEVRIARQNAKAATKRLLALKRGSEDSQHDHMKHEGELQNEVKPAHSEGVRSLIPLSELSRGLALRAAQKRAGQMLRSRSRGDDNPHPFAPAAEIDRAKLRQAADSASVRQSKVFNAYAKGGRKGYRDYKDEQTRKHGVTTPKTPRGDGGTHGFDGETGERLGTQKNPRFRPSARKITGGGVGRDSNLPIGTMRRHSRPPSEGSNLPQYKKGVGQIPPRG
jgi:hypothetical protein